MQPPRKPVGFQLTLKRHEQCKSITLINLIFLFWIYAMAAWNSL